MENGQGTGGTGVIKVLFVDDSQIALEILKKMISAAPDIRVVGTARNGKEALEMIPSLDPHVICTDLYMPVMDGLTFTRTVMEKFPKPILVVSVSVQKDSINAFRLLEAGAVDVLLKPRNGLESEYLEQSQELLRMIRVLSGVRVFRRYKRESRNVAEEPDEKTRRPEMIAIGASTGGPQTLQYIFSRLPKDLPMPVVCVQHINPDFLQGLVDWLQSACAIKIKIAREEERPEPSTIYFPGKDAHLEIDRDRRFRYSIEPPVDGHRPSITATFRSVAKIYGKASIGVLLTGMGNDGAAGMEAIDAEGGITIAQNERTSIVFSMPKRAIELGAAKYILALDEIPGEIVSKAYR